MGQCEDQYEAPEVSTFEEEELLAQFTMVLGGCATGTQFGQHQDLGRAPG